MRRFPVQIMLLLLCLVNNAFPGEPSPGQDSLTAWYQLLETMPEKKLDERLLLLKNYLEQHPGFDRVYLQILNNYRECGDLKSAEQFFQKKGLKPECRRNSYWALAKLYGKEKRYSEALAAFHIALQQINPPAELCKDYWNFINFSPVQPLVSDTLFILKYNKNYRSLFYTYRDYYKSNFAGTVHKILPLLKTGMAKESMLFILGYCFIQSGQYNRADSVIQTGLTLARKNNDMGYEIKFTSLSGLLCYYQVDITRAIDLLQTALAQAQKTSDTACLRFIYENLGMICFSQRDYVSSQNYYQQAIRASRLYEINVKEEYFHFQIALIKYDLQQYSQALSLFESSEIEAVKNKNRKLLLEIYLYKTRIYKNISQYEIAEREYNKIIALAEQENLLTPQKSCEIAAIRVNSYLNNGKYAQGRAILMQLLPQYAGSGDNSSLAWCLSEIGLCWLRQQDYKQSVYYYRQAQKISRLTNDPVTAAWYQLRVADGQAFMGNFDLAIAGIDSVIALGKKFTSVFLLRNAYLRKGRVYERAKNIDLAIKNYQYAIPYTESPRETIKEEEYRIGYFSDNFQGYRGLTMCFCNRFITSGNPADLDSLFYYEEMQRGRALKDVMQKMQVNRNPGDDNPAYQDACRNLQKKQRALRMQAGALHSNDEWDRMISELEAAKYELIEQKLCSPDSLKYNKSKIPQTFLFTLSNLQKYLEWHNCGMIMYHIDEQGSFALVATKDTAGAVTLPVKPDSLNIMVNTLMLAMRDTDEQSIAEIPFHAALAHRLYTLLYQPVAAQYNLPERLFIIPEGVLLNLPFEILLQQTPEKPVYTPADSPAYTDYFLQHKHAFFYSPTSAIFREKKSPLASKKPMLIIANPHTRVEESADKMLQFRARTGWRFDPLPFADNEGTSIKKIAGKANLFNRDKANEQVFMQRASQYNIIHLATHAFIDTSFDAFSGLIMTSGDDSTGDGILMGYEIKSMQLNCDLVTLSACETGRGKYIQTEGILGLPRLFLGAGARAVLISLWKVDDRFTSLLMPEFYRFYLQDKMTRVDALANAKRTLLNTSVTGEEIHYQHPFFWAAFTLYGDPGAGSKSRAPVIVIAFAIFGIFTVAGGCWFIKKNGGR